MIRSSETLRTRRLSFKTVRRLFGDPIVFMAALLLLAIVLGALLAPYLNLPDPLEGNLLKRLQPPGTPGHPLGTDEFGRDMLSRLLWGGRMSLMVGFGAVALSMTVGVTLGLLSGYIGGTFDLALMRLVDIIMAFPYILLALAIVAILGPGLGNAMLAIAIAGIPYYLRIARGSALTLKNQEFVQAAQALGAPGVWILFRHVLPNSLSPLIVAATLDVGWMIMAAAGMSFLGLGAQPPTAEWGVMLSNGRQYLRNAAWVSVLPGLMIFFVVLALNIVGDRLRDLLDPRAVKN